MFTLRRVLGFIAIVLLVAVGYAAWTGWQIKSDLEAAEGHARDLQTAVEADDRAAAERAADDLQSSSSDAAERADGVAWRAVGLLPWAGDDAEGVRALATSLETLAGEVVPPLLDTSDLLGDVSTGDGVDVRVVRDLQDPVTTAGAALTEAADYVAALDSDGFADVLREPFEEYVDLITQAEGAFEAATTATDLLPTMLGGDEPRDYLLIFQNNAEIRATGGLPGAWAHIRADNGRLAMVEQGSTADFPERAEPVLPLTPAERAVYDRQLGTYFHDANFTPDFPRAAELWTAHFEEDRETDLDGVIALDTVALSYLLEGTGPVTAGDVTIDSDSAVDVLLHETYRELADPAAQDARFQAMALAVFEAVTGEPESPMGLAEGFGRAGREGRLLVHSYDSGEQEQLTGTAVAGELETEATEEPVVDVALNDATGAKMSYYLRYGVKVRAETCVDDQQRLAGSMRIGSTISQAEVEDLPPYISGAGVYGTEPGSQLVLARIYGPVGGEISDVKFDGEPFDVEPVELDGRPVATLVTGLTPTDNVDVTWRMTTGDGQTGDGTVGVTPSIASGDADTTFESAC